MLFNPQHLFCSEFTIFKLCINRIFEKEGPEYSTSSLGLVLRKLREKSTSMSLKYSSLHVT